MRMDDVGQLFGGAFDLHRDHGFGDQLGRVWPYYVYPKNFAVFGIGDNLDEALVLANNAGTRVRREGELANLYLVALLLRLGFSEADAADLRMAIRCVRYA